MSGYTEVTTVPLSRCPHCGARGVHQTDVQYLDGYQVRSDYCGRCGKNVPAPKSIPPSGRDATQGQVAGRD